MYIRLVYMTLSYIYIQSWGPLLVGQGEHCPPPKLKT